MRSKKKELNPNEQKVWKTLWMEITIYFLLLYLTTFSNPIITEMLTGTVILKKNWLSLALTDNYLIFVLRFFVEWKKFFAQFWWGEAFWWQACFKIQPNSERIDFSTFFNNFGWLNLSREKKGRFFASSNRAFSVNLRKTRFFLFSRKRLFRGKTGEKVRRKFTEKWPLLSSGCKKNKKTQKLGVSHLALFVSSQGSEGKVVF
jgi:hypothetical protein